MHGVDRELLAQRERVLRLGRPAARRGTGWGHAREGGLGAQSQVDAAGLAEGRPGG
ncbi:hypothetical protein ACFY7H_22070 [Streptomyces sp. NPDC012794]|uniref:hypothetical protein n=1 Tax=Streptomyces sp. NPDC012794 TaxID=3364850 RepID=UPI0036A2D36D